MDAYRGAAECPPVHALSHNEAVHKSPSIRRLPPALLARAKRASAPPSLMGAWCGWLHTMPVTHPCRAMRSAALMGSLWLSLLRKASTHLTPASARLA